MDSPECHPKYIFISDLHLGGFDTQKNDFLEEVLSGIVKFALNNDFGLIINGDFLDYYMQYGDWIPDVARKPFQILSEFNLRSPIPAVYITGNHDNWDVDYIAKTGCTVIHESYILKINNKKVLITHGDGLKDPEFNFPRPEFHRLLRNPYFVKVFKSLTTPSFGNYIMKRFAKFKRELDGEDSSNTRKLDTWATTMLKKFDFDVVICGHHHQLRHLQISDKIYINTGCFYRDLTFAIYTNNGFELVYWNNNTNEIIPHTPSESIKIHVR